MKKKKKENKKIFDSKIFQLFLCLVIAIIIYLILVFITNSNNFKDKILNSNTNSMFTMADLTIKNVTYGDLISTVETEFGKPLKKESFKDNKINYKTYYYDGAELTFKEDSGSYLLMKVKVTDRGYLVSRDIQVGDNINDVLNKYLIINTKNEYLYGNHKETELTGKKVNENIYFGKREKNLVYYLYMDAPYKNGYASWKDNMATITFKVSMNKVKEIEWMYGPVQE